MRVVTFKDTGEIPLNKEIEEGDVYKDHEAGDSLVVTRITSSYIYVLYSDGTAVSFEHDEFLRDNYSIRSKGAEVTVTY